MKRFGKTALGTLAMTLVAGLAFLSAGSNAQQSGAESKQAILENTFADIQGNPELMDYALIHGGAAFRQHCAQCHGVDGRGQVGANQSLV